MSERAGLVKDVREGLSSLQARTNERITALEGNVRKALDGWVVRGRTQGRAWAGRVAPDEARRQVEGLARRAGTALETAGRERATMLAGGLRRAADRLETLAARGQGAETH